MRLLRNKTLLLFFLCGALIANVTENLIEMKYASPTRGFERAAAFSQSEHSSTLFQGHRELPTWAVYVCSFAYFLAFPAMITALIVTAARRRDPRSYVVAMIALTVDYLLSSLFFVLYPVPERWYFGDSGASLLSNRLSYSLVQFIRPFSGITHCFPSFHTSASVIVVTVAFIFAFPWRWTAIGIGVVIIASTVVLGIHWWADIASGIGMGLLSTSAALFVSRLARWRAGDWSLTTPTFGLSSTPARGLDRRRT
jgi:membrane-associated phospholipid phosphatase